jgi:nucleotidyltransferase/DNA polymerase involved in DNA repair
MAEGESIRPRPSGSDYTQQTAKRAPLRLLETPAGWGEAWATQQLQRADPSLLHVRIPVFAAAMVLRTEAGRRDQPLIIGHNVSLGGRGTVLAASPAAAAEGVLPGMTLRAAEKLCPTADVLAVDPPALERAAQDVLAILGRYTPLVEPEWQASPRVRGARARAGTRRGREQRQPPGVVADLARLARGFGATLDVHGCERLFGPPWQIAERIGADLRELGYTAWIGLATNAALAAVASALAASQAAPQPSMAPSTRPPSMKERPGVVQPDEAGETPALLVGPVPLIVPAGGERAFLEGVPLTLLESLDNTVREGLRVLGITRAGQVARLPAAGLERRFGAAGQEAHAQARGDALRPILAPLAPETIDATCQIEDPTADLLQVQRELGRLATRLAGTLTARGQSAAQIGLAVTVQHSSDLQRLLTRRLQLKQPVTGAPAILARAQELLIQIAPTSPIAAIQVELAELGPGATQLSFPLITGPSPAGATLEQISQRLRSRFGPNAARRVHLVEDALLPENRVRWEGMDATPARHARPITVQTDANGLPEALCRKPGVWEMVRDIGAQWRLRTGWWAEPTHRYYYLVETSNGAMLEIYQEQRDGAWYLTNTHD